MTTLRVVVTDTAERHLETIRAWWANNRRDAPLLFVEEVEGAFERISRAPLSGTLYRRTTIRYEVASCSDAPVSMSTTRAISTVVMRSFELYDTPHEGAGRVWVDVVGSSASAPNASVRGAVDGLRVAIPISPTWAAFTLPRPQRASFTIGFSPAVTRMGNSTRHVDGRIRPILGQPVWISVLIGSR